jgi:hypothetical protein
MAEVASYGVLFYGSPEGYQTNRAQIYLSDAAGQPLAYVRFNDPEMVFEEDYEADGIIRMHMLLRCFQASSMCCATSSPSTSTSRQGVGSSARPSSR